MKIPDKVKNKKLNDKTKKIITNSTIGALSVALVTVGGIQYKNYSAETKKLSAEPSTVVEAIEGNNMRESETSAKDIVSSDDDTTKETGSTTATKSNTTTKTITTTTTEATPTVYTFNQKLSLKNGFSLSLIQGKINSNNFKLQIQANNIQAEKNTPENMKFTVDISKLVLIDNNGGRLNINGTVVPCIVACYNNEGTKTWIPYACDTSMTSITATYTFDDGTVSSVILNLQ